MYKFSKLFTKSALYGVVFITVLASMALLLLITYATQQTQSQQKKIQAISLPFAQSDLTKTALASSLVTMLTASHDYQTLIIKKDTIVLINYQNNSVHVLDALLAKPQSVLLKKLNLTIEYQLSFSTIITFSLQLFIAIIALTLVFIFITARLSYQLQIATFHLISKQVGHELSRVNDIDFIAEEKTNQHSLDIPALKEGIANIKSMMAKHVKVTRNLETQAHIDRLTGIENRNRFVQFYEDNIVKDSPVRFGVIAITRCSELQTINQTHGYHSGDDYILSVAQIMKNILTTIPTAKIFRLNSSDFATLLPNEKLKTAEAYASELTLKFNAYQQKKELSSVAFTGLVYFDKSKPLGELLALADTGVSIAQTQQSNAWYSQKDTNILTDKNAQLGSQHWRQEIDSVLEGGRISLLLQPIKPNGRNTTMYGEILARFINTNGDTLPTASFIAMAEKLDKIIDLDRLIIETAINEITSKNMLTSRYGINLSPRSINDEHFMIWLERKLLREPTVSSVLVFEVSELGLQQNIKAAKRLVDMLHRVGSKVTVERFGVGFTSFKFFRDLTPDYIKMDSSYTRDIDIDKNNQYFLRLMVDLAHRLSINVLAESVESQEEKHTLERLFIDGCQGYYIGKPIPL